MTTSIHIRGGLILWREVLESSSRREGPPRPTRGYSLSRRFGTREIATWTEGLFCEVEADLSSKLERLRIPGLSRKIYYALSPQRLSLLPYLGISCAGAAPCVVPGSDREGDLGGGGGDGDGSTPALSVGSALDFFLRKGIYCVLPALPGS